MKNLEGQAVKETRAMTNSEARKRAQEAASVQISGRHNSTGVGVDPGATEPAKGAENGAQRLDLAEIEARVEAATEGPWEAREGDLEGKPASEYVRTILANREADGTSSGRLFLTLAPNPIDPENGDTVVPAMTGDGPQSEPNATFIAHARADIPALIARVRELEAALARVEALVDAVGDSMGGPVNLVYASDLRAALATPTTEEDEG